MNTYLCRICGTQMDDTMRTCPVCGGINYRNKEILVENQKLEVLQQKAERKISAGMHITSLVIGIILFVVHMVFLVLNLSSFMMMESFVGAVCSGLMVFFSILGMSKGEETFKGIWISGGISIWFLVMNLFFLL